MEEEEECSDYWAGQGLARWGMYVLGEMKEDEKRQEWW